MTMTLATHIAFGTGSVLLGLICLAVQKVRGPHSVLGEFYHLTTLVAVASGFLLALDPIDPALIAIAVLTYAFTLGAYISAKRRFRRWLYIHAPCMLLSVFFLVEAVFITNWELITMGYAIPNGWAWLTPALFFYPAIGITIFRVKEKRYAA